MEISDREFLETLKVIFNPSLDAASDDFVMDLEQVARAAAGASQEEVDAFVNRMYKAQEKQAADRNSAMPEGLALVLNQLDTLMNAYIHFVQLVHEHREVCSVPEQASH